MRSLIHGGVWNVFGPRRLALLVGYGSGQENRVTTIHASPVKVAHEVKRGVQRQRILLKQT